jgi:hypothetical protein
MICHDSNQRFQKWGEFQFFSAVYSTGNFVHFPAYIRAAISQMHCALKLPSIFQFAFAAFPCAWAGRKFLDVTKSMSICLRRQCATLDWTKRGIASAADSLRGGFRRPTLFGRILRQTGWLE